MGVVDIWLLLYILCPGYKNLFLTKKQTDHVWHLNLAWVQKGEVTPDNMAPKNYLPLSVENYYWTLCTQ